MPAVCGSIETRLSLYVRVNALTRPVLCLRLSIIIVPNGRPIFVNLRFPITAFETWPFSYYAQPTGTEKTRRRKQIIYFLSRLFVASDVNFLLSRNYRFASLPFFVPVTFATVNFSFPFLFFFFLLFFFKFRKSTSRLLLGHSIRTALWDGFLIFHHFVVSLCFILFHFNLFLN